MLSQCFNVIWQIIKLYHDNVVHGLVSYSYYGAITFSIYSHGYFLLYILNWAFILSVTSYFTF